MKIVISPDSFKECLPAWKVAEALATGWRKVLPGSQLVCLPVADGGEGTLETLIHATDGTFYTKKVTGPLGESIHAQYGILGNQTTAVIELAQASGLDWFLLSSVLPFIRRRLALANLFSPPWNTILIPLFYAWVAVLQMMAVLG